MSITRDEVLKMDLKSIYAAIKDPNTAAAMQNLLGTRGSGVATHVAKLMADAQQRENELDAQIAVSVPPSTEELAAQATEMAATAEVATPVVETAVETPVVVERKKIVREYQVRDEDGTPIGRPTHLEAWSIDEMLEKMQTAHENATRAFHRLKKQKLTFKQEPKTILTPEQIAEAAKIALESKDSSKVTDVIHAAIEAEYTQREQAIFEKERFESEKAISNEFMRRHLHDYKPCEANLKVFGEYFQQEELEFTLDNLEAAFLDLMSQNKLVAVEAVTQRQVAPAANPVVAASAAAPTVEIPPTVTPAAEIASAVTPQVVVTPVVETTVATPAAVPNAQQAARRPGVNGGIAPGTLSAQRPGTPDPALARKEFLKTVRDMKPDVMKAKLKSDPQFVKQLESYGIRVR